MRQLVLHIDRLVLQGVPAQQRERFVAQLQAALAEQFAAPGVAERWAAAGHRVQVRQRLPVSAMPANAADTAAHALVNLAPAPGAQP
jgi:hypothetical protein